MPSQLLRTKAWKPSFGRLIENFMQAMRTDVSRSVALKPGQSARRVGGMVVIHRGETRSCQLLRLLRRHRGHCRCTLRMTEILTVEQMAAGRHHCLELLERRLNPF